MSNLRGIEADFATWRPVQGRKVLQLIFEVPIENTQHVLDMLGIPQPGQSKWCAIALLAKKLGQEGSATALAKIPDGEREGLDSASTSSSELASGSPKKWSEIARSQQSAILCGDPSFAIYFGLGEDALPKDVTAKLKAHFRIESRAELDKPENHSRWDEFAALYHLHRDRLR